jgi:hypothetical protein
MPSTDRTLELTAKTSVAQTASQATVYAKGIYCRISAERCGITVSLHNPSNKNTIMIIVLLSRGGLVIVVGIATSCGLDCQGFESRKEQIFSKTFHTDSGVHQDFLSVYFCVYYVGWLLAGLEWNLLAASRHNSQKKLYQLLCIQYLPMMSSKVLETRRGYNQNNLKVNSAFCWSYYTDIYCDSRSTDR